MACKAKSESSKAIIRPVPLILPATRMLGGMEGTKSSIPNAGKSDNAGEEAEVGMEVIFCCPDDPCRLEEEFRELLFLSKSCEKGFADPTSRSK